MCHVEIVCKLHREWRLLPFFFSSWALVAAPKPLPPEDPGERGKEGGREGGKKGAVEVGPEGSSQGPLHSKGTLLPALSWGTCRPNLPLKHQETQTWFTGFPRSPSDSA